MQVTNPTHLAPTWKTLWLPPNYSSFGHDIDHLYLWIFWITIVTFFLVEGAMLWFCFKYRRNPARKAVYTHGSHKLEVAWTIIPTIILVALGVSSSSTWAMIKNQSDPRYPTEFRTTVRIEAQQFAWNVYYSGPDGKIETDADNFMIQNVLNVPYEPTDDAGNTLQEENVRVMLTSRDVIHSFFVPVLRLKQDAVPGYIGNVWFDVQRPTSPGPDGKYFTGDDEIYEVACAELCGLGHSQMRMQMKALPRDVWEKWVADESAKAKQAAADGAKPK